MIIDIFATRYKKVLNFDQASAQGVIGPTREARPTMTDHSARRDRKRATLGALAALLILAATPSARGQGEPPRAESMSEWMDS
jgi:hypothetical protein